MSLSSTEQYCVALQSIEGLGLRSLDRLYRHYGSIEALRSASHADLSELGIKDQFARQILAAPTLSDRQLSARLSKIEKWMRRPSHRLLCIDDACYPEILKQIHCAPWLLYIKGRPEILQRPALAIVGSRKPTIDGARSAHAFAATLAQTDLVVHSGLALGIDAAAHQGVLEVEGCTGAVLATGIDRIYPRQHQALAEQIVERGALVSEMPLGTAPQAQNFPRRNRLISGLSRGVLVVEAGVQSGSLITARYALEQNRDVFALPGSIFNPQARGPHALIKAGAKLVEEVNDILAEWVYPLPQMERVSKKTAPSNLSASQVKLLSLMGFDVRSFDELLVLSGLALEVLMEELVALELLGLLQPVAGGYQRVYQVESGR